MEKLPSNIFNGVPDYDATGRQKRAITKLCMAQGIREPIEEKLMTLGVAGRLIRELYAKLRVKEKMRMVKVLGNNKSPSGLP